MKKYIPGKYKLISALALVLLVTDVILHKGMSRTLIPSSFTALRAAQVIAPCREKLTDAGKDWCKAVNTVDKLNLLDTSVAGIEMDVYFDSARTGLLAFHDSGSATRVPVTDILNRYRELHFRCPVWFDFKNLNASNEEESLRVFIHLRNEYSLQQKMVIESSFPQYLQSFCRSGFFTSYYVPLFNPYLIREKEQIRMIDQIRNKLESYPVAALSGYYFQYPFLKKYFPGFPILTWMQKPGWSLVGRLFHQKLRNDQRVMIILTDYDNSNMGY